MTEKRYDKDNPRFRDEFGCVNDLLTGESYLCGNSAMVGERDAIDTAIVLCDLLNSLYDENEQLKEHIKKLESQLLYTDSVCHICNYHYLMQGNDGYYVSKCKKGHEECSKIDLNYCEDFKLVDDYK